MASLEDQLDRIEQKLDENTAQTIANTVNLNEHMRRTAVLETEIAKRLPPLEQHVAAWAGASKVMAVVGSILAMLGAIATFLKWVV